MTDRQPPNRAMPLGPVSVLRTHFLLAFFFAAAGSLLLALRGHSWLPPIWAAACMIVYWLLTRYRLPEHVATEAFADNYYFLGFLLTLVSLFAVFVQLGNQPAPASSDELLRIALPQFGMALITTIVGLVGRTLILMTDLDAEEVAERAEGRLTRAFDEFIRSLNRLTTEADAFSQGFGERLRNSIATIERTATDFVALVQDTASGLKPIRDDFANVSDSLKASLDAITSATDALIVAVSTSKESLESLFITFRDSINAAAKDVQAYTSGLDALDKVKESTAEIASHLSALRASLADLKAVVDSVAAAVDPDKTGLSTTAKNLRVCLEQLAKLHSQLADEASGASAAVVQVRKEIAAGIDFLVQTLGHGVKEHS